MEMVEVDEVEDVMTTEKMAEIPIKVLCAGMSVAMSSLTEFAIGSAEGYAELVNQWENAIAKCSRVLAGLEHNITSIFLVFKEKKAMNLISNFF